MADLLLTSGAEVVITPPTDISVFPMDVEIENPSSRWNFNTAPPSTDLDTFLVPGPPGPAGPAGPAGPPGPEGPAGGQRFYGEGPPTTVIGASPGDEYVDTLTGDLYYLS